MTTTTAETTSEQKSTSDAKASTPPVTSIDDQTRKLAAIAYGEASTANNSDEIGGIAFAVANRARA